jgi:nicotinamidase/pyrazinamidase
MKTVFFDVDTQIDFLYPAGALAVPGAERLVPALARLNRAAAERGHVVISTMDAHDENDEEFREWPPHCVRGTLGQHKPAETLLERRMLVSYRRRAFDVDGAAQVILQKRSVDCFTNPNLPELLERLGAERYVVYGVATEVCVWHAVAGLLKTGARVELVEDAVAGLREEAVAEVKRKLADGGGRLVMAAGVLG